MKKIIFAIILFISFIFNIYASELKITDTNYNSITLTYSSSSQYYKIYRSTNKKNYYLVATTDKTTYKDSKLSINKTYYYKVKPYNIIEGKKVFETTSNIVYSKTRLKKADVTIRPFSGNSEKLKISYNKVYGATYYQIYESKYGKTYKLIKTTKNLSYVRSNLLNNKKYYYKVRSYRIVNGKKYYSYYTYVNETTIPQVTFSLENYNYKIIKLLINTSTNATSYKVYRSNTKTGTYSYIGTTNTNEYFDNTIEENKYYYYKVRALRTIEDKNYYGSYSLYKYIKSRTVLDSDYPTFNTIYIKENTESFILNIQTDQDNLVSFNNSEYTTDKSITINSNNNEYVIKVKNPIGLITTKTISITNIVDPNYPTFEINYLKENAISFELTIDTDENNLVSFNNSEYTTNKSITINSNNSNYVIKVKNPDGYITTKTININNIKTYEELNNIIINDIYNTYGFHVYYGEGTSFWYDYESCTVLTDHEKANTALKSLITAVQEFPDNFFKTFIGKNGYSVTLFDDIPGDVAGLASYEFGDNNQMIIDVNSGFFGRVFYHETWHIMESYIRYETYEDDYNLGEPFETWNTLNPTGFVYNNSNGNIYTTFDYNYDNGLLTWNNPIKDIAFATEYGKSSPYEDRAELFADLMFRPFQKEYMHTGFGINTKAIKLSQIIDTFFTDIDSSDAKWNKWIEFN